MLAFDRRLSTVPGDRMSANTRWSSSHTAVVPFGERFGVPSGTDGGDEAEFGLDDPPHVLGEDSHGQSLRPGRIMRNRMRRSVTGRRAVRLVRANSLPRPCHGSGAAPPSGPFPPCSHGDRRGSGPRGLLCLRIGLARRRALGAGGPGAPGIEPIASCRTETPWACATRCHGAVVHDEHPTPVFARVTAIDPSQPGQGLGDLLDNRSRTKGDGQIDDRLGQQSRDRRGPDVLHLDRVINQDPADVRGQCARMLRPRRPQPGPTERSRTADRVPQLRSRARRKSVLPTRSPSGIGDEAIEARVDAVGERTRTLRSHGLVRARRLRRPRAARPHGPGRRRA